MAKKKNTKADDYRSLDDQALADRIASEQQQLKRTVFSHAVNPLENPLVIRQLRRNIARLKTEQRKRAIGA